MNIEKVQHLAKKVTAAAELLEHAKRLEDTEIELLARERVHYFADAFERELAGWQPRKIDEPLADPWRELENSPGFTEAMERGVEQIAAGRTHKWADIKRHILDVSKSALIDLLGEFDATSDTNATKAELLIARFEVLPTADEHVHARGQS